MEELQRLKEITDRLRDPGGCEWDRKQDFMSMRDDLLEEVYELIDAVDRMDVAHIEEELGDVLFVVLFYVRLGEEKGHYSLSSVAQKVADKLVRRHPHVFGDQTVSGVQEILTNWESIKQSEKEGQSSNGAGTKQYSLPNQAYSFLPALKRAQKLGTKAARKGFDWPTIEGAYAKVDEELAELNQAIKQFTAAHAGPSQADTQAEQEAMADELGDVLFTICNVARHLDIPAELALQKTCAKFISRFQYIEDHLQAAELQTGASLDRLEELWQAAKKPSHD